MKTTAKKSKKTTDVIKAAKASKKAIARRNAAFEKMSPAEKRVAIAKDVLAQIKSKKLIPAHMVWVNSTTPRNTTSNGVTAAKDVKADTELQEILRATPTCHVCALGALFTCAVKVADDLKVKELAVYSYDADAESGRILVEKSDRVIIVDEDIFGYLKLYFPLRQLRRMEYAFELGDGTVSARDVAEGKPEVIDAIHAIYKKLDATERITAIAKNIIDNGGNFVVPRRAIVEARNKRKDEEERVKATENRLVQSGVFLISKPITG